MKKFMDALMHSKFWKGLFLTACIGRICSAAFLFTAAISAIQRGDEDWWTNLPELMQEIA